MRQPLSIRSIALWAALCLPGANVLFGAEKTVADIRMRDGTTLKAHIWLPAGDGPFPVVLQRFYRAGDFPFGREQFLQAGYATVHAEIRDADGDIGTRFTRDDLDGYDTVEWVAARDWCNGQVAMYGKSAGGITALAAASARPPHLRAIIPMNSGETWRWGYRANGAVTLAMAANGRAVPDIRQPPWGTERDAFMFLPLQDLDLQGRSEENPLWNQMVSNNEWNAFYQQKRLRIEQIDVPVLLIGGWWDYYAGSAFRFRSQLLEANPGLEVRVIIGATNHVSRLPADGRQYPGGREDSAAEAIRWLDHVLRDSSNGAAKESPIKVFTMRANRWQQLKRWPPTAAATRYYLSSNGKGRRGVLSTARPGNESPSRYVYDPQQPVPTLGGNHSLHFQHRLVPVGSYDHSAHESRSDVLVFSTPPLAEAIEVTGNLEMNLWAASDARDTDWTAIVLDVDRAGTPYNVTMGILRARFRNGVYEAPQLLSPGKVEHYRWELMPTSYRFEAGHQIRVYLSSSNFPLWDRNPNTGGHIGRETKTVKAHQSVFHDVNRPSYLSLPIVKTNDSN